MKPTGTTALAALFAALSAAAALADYPERPIAMIVPWSAGGAADTVARALANEMETALGAPVEVVNRTGGAGLAGHAEIVGAQPDGYTIGLATVELSTYYWSGEAQFTAMDVTPIALVSFDPSSFNVPAQSDWTDLRAAIDAIDAAPAGTYKTTGTAPEAGYRLAFSGLLHLEGVDPNKLAATPTHDSAPGFQELASGAAHVQPSSLPEAKPSIDAGKVRSLAVLAPERLPAFPDVPTVKEAIGLDWVGGAWRGVIGPVGLPKDIAGKLRDATDRAWRSESFQRVMTRRGYGLAFKNGKAFGAFLIAQHEHNGEAMRLLGLKRRN